jgi:hypothetical protein
MELIQCLVEQIGSVHNLGVPYLSTGFIVFVDAAAGAGNLEYNFTFQSLSNE